MDISDFNKKLNKIIAIGNSYDEKLEKSYDMYRKQLEDIKLRIERILDEPKYEGKLIRSRIHPNKRKVYGSQLSRRQSGRRRK